jgi:hypothetical protein
MADRIVAYLGLPISQTDPTLSWRLVGEDQDTSAARLVFRDTMAKQTQSYHGSEQVLYAAIPQFAEAPRRVDGVSAAELMKQLEGEPIMQDTITAAHVLSKKMASLPRKSNLRRIYAARVRLACPGHTGGPMVEPPGLTLADNPAVSCGTCMHFCPTRNICKMYGDYPVTPNLVCPSWEG